VNRRSRFHGCLLGLACGDALGTTVEFSPRGAFQPLTDMIGGGPFDLLPGQWTDDTSMALCLATSLVEQKQFDPDDQMTRYCRWASDGYLSSTDSCFDIGNTVNNALRHYRATGEPFSGSKDPGSAGNGSIMRLAPVPMFFYPHLATVISGSGESSRTTHGAQECVDACKLFGAILFAALDGQSKEQVLFDRQWPESVVPLLSNRIVEIGAGSYGEKSRSEIKGTGYVVESLEAALWCFLGTSTYRDAVLEAANLGDDADTTAAICGQVAGAFYGVDDIPASWLARLSMATEIVSLADKLYDHQPENDGIQ
jgi:ADP-ribosylglycohydrolase